MTCNNPEIKYGTMDIFFHWSRGLPRNHRYNDYEKWCNQLGGWYVRHTLGTRSGHPLWGTTGYGADDPENWHWCSWYNPYDWYNKPLTKHETYNDFITSITCNN